MGAEQSPTTEFNGYRIRVFYAGDRPSPFDKTNFDCTLVAVMNTLTKRRVICRLWQPRISTKSEVLFTFYKVLQSCMIGSSNPEQFCAVMHLDPKNPESERRFLLHREIASRMAPIVANRDELLKTMRMLQQHLGIKEAKI